jgi:hypothetical protein
MKPLSVSDRHFESGQVLPDGFELGWLNRLSPEIGFFKQRYDAAQSSLKQWLLAQFS